MLEGNGGLMIIFPSFHDSSFFFECEGKVRIREKKMKTSKEQKKMLLRFEYN